ncbi:MAG: DNA polymerase III subunit delta' [Arenimonas sp.]|nr:DNA polymerase III subunit delta' [Arenimonas sp.]
MNFLPWQERFYNSLVDGFTAGKLGHAQLITGPAKLGKHDLAERLAKRLLCQESDGGMPACGHCLSCQRFASGTHGDYRSITLELNEKTGKLRTEITVDQIRAFNDWLSLTSQLGGGQVAIIRNAHELNRNAANALLKTLEEPLENRYVLIVTDKPYRLPATIHSRCQRVVLHVPDTGTGLQWLADQGVTPENAALALDLANGNPGIAKELLDTGSLVLFAKVREQLLACMKGHIGASELAKLWLADEYTELRLNFAVQIAFGLARKWAMQAGAWDKTNRSLGALQEWIDAANRLRLSLSQPLRHDLSLAGLFYDWRNLLQDSRTG